MVSFAEYKSWIDKFINNHDTREINFQNDVVKKLLEKLFLEYDIVSVDTKGRESKRHDYYAYSRKYEDAKGRTKPTTPDLLVCNNWDWYNKNNDKIKYIATVEVKSPYSSQAIYKKTFSEYPEDLKIKINRHLSAEKVNKVVLTDTYSWVFFEEVYKESEHISFVYRVPFKNGYTYEWYDDAEKRFNKLKEKLYEFLN